MSIISTPAPPSSLFLCSRRRRRNCWTFGLRHVSNGDESPLQGIRVDHPDCRGRSARADEHSANYKVMFLQGGASLQLPSADEFPPGRASADYIVKVRGARPLERGQQIGNHLPGIQRRGREFQPPSAPEEFNFDQRRPTSTFVNNETIHGVEFKAEPTPPRGVELFCDMSLISSASRSM